MSNKIDKAILKSPDVFVSTSDKVFNYIEHHFKTAATVFAAIVVAGVAYAGYGFLRSHNEMNAAEALYVPEAALRKAQAVLPDIKNKEAPAKTEDFTKDYAPAVEQIKTAIKAHSDTRAALVSALSLSNFLMQQKQYAQALEVLQLAPFSPSANDVLGGFWYMQRGLVLLENGQTEPAIEAYDKVLKSPALKAFYPEALLKLGVSREIKGESEKAREAYERLYREYPETEAAQNAQQFLRLMQMKTPQQG